LPDPAEYLIYVARVLAENTALQHPGEGRAAIVPDFTKPADALVRVNAKNRTVHRRTSHDGYAQIRDPQRRGARIRIHVQLKLRGCSRFIKSHKV
jgi:hypothetical protein